MNDEKLKRWVTLGIAAAIAAAFLWFFGKYLLSCLLPFIIAYMISLAVRPAAAFISRRAGVGKRFVSAFIVLVLIFAIVLLLSYVSTVLVKEAASAAQAASEWLLRDEAGEPVISRMVLESQVPVSIIFADTREVGDVTYGHMVVGLPKDPRQAAKIKAWLEQSTVDWRVEKEEVI